MHFDAYALDAHPCLPPGCQSDPFFTRHRWSIVVKGSDNGAVTRLSCHLKQTCFTASGWQSFPHFIAAFAATNNTNIPEVHIIFCIFHQSAAL
jgi:hypothetical protein